MVTILKYVLFGILFYIVVIPTLEQLTALMCQGLEVAKGWLIYKQSIIQKQINEESESESKSETFTQAIGFQIPTDECYEEEEEEYDE